MLDETLPLKEGEQCKSNFYERIGGKTYWRETIQPCEEGLKCTDDPNDTNNGFCRKEGRNFRIMNECKCTLQFNISNINVYPTSDCENIITRL